MRRFLASVGLTHDPTSWDGIPFHFQESFFLRLREAGLVDAMLPLSAAGRAIAARRYAWNAARALTGDRPGGFQYSTTFLERAWAPHRDAIRDGFVVNCFQLFPPSVVRDARVRKWFFWDQTLAQLFDHYGVAASIGRRIAEDARRRCDEGVAAADGLIVHSRWAARSAIEDHGADPSKVHVVQPGANLDPAAYDAWEADEMRRRKDAEPSPGPLRLVFAGKDWKRKGLDRLLRALPLARRQGADVTLRVIGCDPAALPPELSSIPGVEWTGFIDKRRDPRRFLDLVGSCDVGCLLSHAEAGGIVLREYHALGLATLATTAGGAPEHANPRASIPVATDADDAAIASLLGDLASEHVRLAGLRSNAWADRRLYLWQATVQAVGRLWQPSA